MEEKKNFQLDKKWLGKGYIISCIINQSGYMIALAYDHDKVKSTTAIGLKKKNHHGEKRDYLVFLRKHHYHYGLFWRPKGWIISLSTKLGWGVDCYLPTTRKMVKYNLTNHDKYHFNHKKLIAGQKEWEVNRIFSDLSKGLIPKLKK